MTANPYHPPPEVPANPPGEVSATSPLANFCIGLLLFVVFVAFVAEHIQHASIVFTGPVLLVCGLLLTIVSVRHRLIAGIVLGNSAMALCFLVFFLINFNGWGPAQGDGPITMMAYAYVALMMPFGLLIIFLRRSTDNAVNH